MKQLARLSRCIGAQVSQVELQGLLSPSRSSSLALGRKFSSVFVFFLGCWMTAASRVNSSRTLCLEAGWRGCFVRVDPLPALLSLTIRWPEVQALSQWLL